MTEPKRPRRGSRSLRQILSATVLATAALTTWAACSTKPTEIVAGVTTQLQVPKYLKTVGIAVQLGGRLVFCEAYPVYDGSVTLPSTIGVVPAEGDSPTEPVTVQILGFRTEQSQFANDCIANIPDVGDDEDGDGTPEVMVVRRRRLPYDPDRIVYLPMPLRESCAEVRCGDDETCLGGVCEPADVDPATLEDYDDSFVFGNTNTCFDPSRCLPEQALVPALLEDEAKCTYRVPWPMDAPAPTPGDMNVRIVYDTFGTEILDLDPIEGFIMPDPQDPLLIQLAPNMCEGVVKKGRMLAIQAAPLCPAKRPLQPICDGALSAIVQAQNAVVGGGQESLCTQASLLVPTESALYVLMDRSQSMSEFYGPDGLNVAINTPLENPIAKETRVGLSPLPATSCDAENQFATNLLVPFGKVDAVRAPIGSFLGDPMLQADAPLHLEAAMAGGYAALGALTDEDGGSLFNRRALVIVGNRDFEPGCGLGASTEYAAPEQLAADALANQGIYTYVVTLDAPNGAPMVGDPVGQGTLIANAGGTTLFDDINNEGDGAFAVQEIMNDLGSCLYDAPPQGTFKDDLVPAGASLSYLNPVTLQRTDVPKNDACVEGATVSGWNQEGPNEPVRICGQACDDLRGMLNDVALTYALLGKPAPQMPVQVTAPCLGSTSL